MRPVRTQCTQGEVQSTYEVTLNSISFNEVAQREPGAGREQTPSQPEDQVFFGQVSILNLERKNNWIQKNYTRWFIQDHVAI